jgi:hypothetical protein
MDTLGIPELLLGAWGPRSIAAWMFVGALFGAIGWAVEKLIAVLREK